MAELTINTEVTYDLTGLTRLELLMIYQLVSRVEGHQNKTYKNLSQNIYNLIWQKTNWPSSDFNPNMIRDDYKIYANQRTED